MARVRLLCGSIRSGRRAAIDAIFCANRAHSTLITPSRRAATERAERLVLENHIPGFWGAQIVAFQAFVAWVLREDGIHANPVDELERRLVLERAVREARTAGALDTLGAAADTEGFLTHVLRVIEGLKQAAVLPEEFAGTVARRTHRSPLDTVVAAIYTAYQDALIGARLFDRIGLYWTASELCAKRRPAAFEAVDTLIFDGFEDFTPSESRFIEQAAPHLSQLVIGLNYNPAPARRDLYALPRRTALRVRRTFDVVEEAFDEDEPRTFTAFAGSNLFWRDPPPKPAGLRADLELLPCMDLVHEAEVVGRRVKTLLLDVQASPNEVAVIYRDLAPVASTLRVVYGEFGIPLRIAHEPSLTESTVCAFLFDVFEAIESWERERVLDVLTSPWFAPNDDQGRGSTAAFPRLARAARVVAGLDEWRSRCAWLTDTLRHRDRAQEEISPLEGLDRPAEALVALLARLDVLQEFANVLPVSETIPAFADAVAAIINQCRMADAVAAHPVQAARDAESSALGALRGVLARLRAHGDRDAGNRVLTRGEFTATLRQALRNASFALPQPPHGVMCLEAPAARNLRFDYVFLCGANEGELPRPPAVSAVYSDEDVADLAQVGISLENKRVHSEREALLFHHMLSTARKHLCITWRMLTPDGEPLKRSPYVADVNEFFPDEAVRADAPPAHGFVPVPAAAASLRDLRSAACFHDTKLRELFKEELGNAAYGATLEGRLRRSESLGPFDGMITDSGLVRQIQARFDDTHVFSVSQLEAYASCPFGFFTQCLLALEPAERPANELDPRLRGAMLHRILQVFYAQGGPGAGALDRSLEFMHACVDKEFLARQGAAPPAVLELERRHMSARLERHLRIEAESGGTRWRPAYFEVAFGSAHGESREPPNRTEPVPIDTPAGVVLFSGRIDRVDVSNDTARIIDYKTSVYTEKKDVMAGRSLQLQVYALALEQLLPDRPCAEAYFIEVGTPKRLEALARGAKKDPWPERERIARETIARCVQGIREGRFAPVRATESSCQFCDAKGMCRFERSRFEKSED
ncbi:MAG TPA: hypothetical protein HPP77_00465 [Candidatus Hydrogenedentes bacterium]|nr:hypothetical protein [Candidatus Hydrogenedentota bacterium]